MVDTEKNQASEQTTDPGDLEKTLEENRSLQEDIDRLLKESVKIASEKSKLEEEISDLQAAYAHVVDDPIVRYHFVSNASKTMNSEQLLKQLSVNEKRMRLKEAYDTIIQYDLHYSNIRSAISVFLLGLALGLAQFALDKSGRRIDLVFMFLVLPAMILFFNYMLNIYFQSLTWACRLLQEWIEIDLSERALSVRIEEVGTADAIRHLPAECELRKVLQSSTVNQHIIFLKWKKRLADGKYKRAASALSEKYVSIIKKNIRPPHFITPLEPRRAIAQTAKMKEFLQAVWNDYPLFYISCAYGALLLYAAITLWLRLAPFDGVMTWKWWSTQLPVASTTSVDRRIGGSLIVPLEYPKFIEHYAYQNGSSNWVQLRQARPPPMDPEGSKQMHPEIQSPSTPADQAHELRTPEDVPAPNNAPAALTRPTGPASSREGPSP